MEEDVGSTKGKTAQCLVLSEMETPAGEGVSYGF